MSRLCTPAPARWESGFLTVVYFWLWTANPTQSIIRLMMVPLSCLHRALAGTSGALAWNVVATAGNAASHTMASGHGLYTAANGAYPASFVNNPLDGSNPSTCSTRRRRPSGPQPHLPSLRRRCVRHRTQSSGHGARRTRCDPIARKRHSRQQQLAFFLLQRSMLGRSAADLPLIWWNAIPHGGSDGMQMHREVVAELAADVPPRISLSAIPRPAIAWHVAASGTRKPDRPLAAITAHRDALDNQRFARLAAPLVARAVLTTGAKRHNRRHSP